MSKERIEWIDALKGIGIISVVAGHIFTGFSASVIYLFHMPLFFVIGGMLFKPSPHIYTFFWKKAVHLLIPYLTFLTLLYAKDILIGLRFLVEDLDVYTFLEFLKILGKGIYGGRELKGWTSVFWFVTCFFLTQQLFSLLYQRLGQAIIYLTPLFLGLGYLNAVLLPNQSFPWNINVVLIAFPFFAIGFYLKKIRISKGLYVVSGLLSLVSILLIRLGYPISFDMKYLVYGIPLVSVLLSIAVIICLIEIAKLSLKFDYLKKALTYLGSASMVIMYLHQPVIITAGGISIVNNAWIKFILSIVIPLSFYHFFGWRSLTRAVFLGSHQDFINIFNKRAFKD